MRLIDADALKKKADMRGRCLRPLVTAFQMCVTVHDIDDTPTIDAVPVVRCKECKHRTHTGSGFPWCDAWEADLFSDEGFCCYGERKDGDTNG